MAVVDFDAVLAGKGLGASTAFRPLIYDADVRAGNVKFPSDADENKNLRYRDRFTSAIGLDQTNCLEGGVPTDPARKADALFVADDSTQDVLVFEGFAKLKAALTALPAATGAKHKDRLLAEGDVTYKPYSRKKDVLDIDTEEDMRISRMRIVKRGADCVPVWLRLERGRASQGSEVSRLQANHKREAMNPLSYVIPTVGSASFGLLSVGEGAQARAFAFTTSYSLGDIHAFEYKASPQSASVDNFVQLQ